MYMFLWDLFIEYSWAEYAIICHKWIAVWTFLRICGKKRPSPVRCDQSAAAIAVVQAHRSRSPEWTVFALPLPKDGSLCSFRATTLWLNSLIYLLVFILGHERTKLSLRRGEGGWAITHFRVQLPGSVDPSCHLDKAYGRSMRAICPKGSHLTCIDCWGWTLAWVCSSLLSDKRQKKHEPCINVEYDL